MHYAFLVQSTFTTAILFGVVLGLILRVTVLPIVTNFVTDFTDSGAAVIGIGLVLIALAALQLALFHWLAPMVGGPVNALSSLAVVGLLVGNMVAGCVHLAWLALT